MNELNYLTDSKHGNSLYWFGFDGFLWVFERVSQNKVTLYDIDPVDNSVEIGKYSTGMSLEELPSPVRQAISTDPRFRYKSRVESVEGAMS